MASDPGQPDSPFGDAPPVNPYEASVFSASPAGLDMAAAKRLPTFVAVMAILSLVFCSIRLLLVLARTLMSLLPGAASAQVSPLYHMDIALSLIAALVGLGAGGLILAKKPSAISLAWVHVGAIVLSIGVGLFEMIRQYSNLSDYGGGITPFSIGFILGGLGAAAIRIVLLVLYVLAILRFRQWLESRQ